MNDEDLLKRIAELQASGASEEEIAAFVDEQQDFGDVGGGASSDSAPAPDFKGKRHPYATVWDQVGRPAVQGISQGTTDNLLGALAAAKAGVTGKPMKPAYLKARDRHNAALERGRVPYLSRGVELLSSAAVPLGGAVKLGKGASMLARGAAAGGVGGAITGLGYAGERPGEITPIGENLDEMSKGAGIGAALGTVGGAVGAGIGKLRAGRAAKAVSGRGGPSKGMAALRSAYRVGTMRMPRMDDIGTLAGLGDELPVSMPAPKPTAESAKAGLRQLGETLREAKGVPPGYRGLPPRPPKPVSGRDWDLTPGPRLDFTTAPPAKSFTVPPSTAKFDALVSDDPLLQAMAAQVARGKPPTPRVSQARGVEPSAPPKARPRPKGGKGTREGIDASARAIGLDPDAIRAKAASSAERKSYGGFMKKHSQGSAQRRGQLEFDARVNAEAKAKMDALQQQADAAPDEETREVLYRAWRKLKDEYGRSTARTVAGTGAAAGGALTAAALAERRR